MINTVQQIGVNIMPFVKVLRHGQVTVPKQYRKLFDIKEGDVLEVKMQKNGVLFEPKILINKEFKEETEKKEWSALATTSFNKDWENEKDAIYDNWEKHYIQKG